MSRIKDNPLLFNAKWLLRSAYGRVGGSQRVGQRVFGVGAAKIGTHSLGQMFEDRARTGHEFDVETLIGLHLARLESGRNEPLHRFLRQRDLYRDLKLDVSHVNLFLFDDLEALFPESLYIMTIRHPVDWLRSFIDDSLGRESSDAFRQLRDYRFNASLEHPEEEKAFQDRGLYTIRGYLNHWCLAIRNVTERLPEDRLLIVQTEDLRPRSGEIANFAGIRSDNVDQSRSKVFVSPQRFSLLSEIPEQYFADTVEEVCGKFIRQYFAPDETEWTQRHEQDRRDPRGSH